MSDIENKPERSRRGVLFGAAGIAGAAALIGAAQTASADDDNRFIDELKVRELATLYALGTDAIGRSDKAAGIAIYHQTFTSNARIMVKNAPGTLSIGPEAWADFVESVFRGSNYDRTQHLMGTVRAIVRGNRATMSSYLTSAHHVADNSSVLVVLGTYNDVVVRVRGEWRIAERTLDVMTSWNEKPN